jgi:diaminohydroxyphosphoribosylaminopyrimidine deaminase/5-amino-6-(5-phosphoribosylamino)uracil reductase
MQDEMYMARALKLAQRGRFTTHPNPNVGCVIVKDGEIVGEGFHYRAGEPHAEVHACAWRAKKRGATAYVTLEPCSHHGRTPPCCEALIAAASRAWLRRCRIPIRRLPGAVCTVCSRKGSTSAMA